LKKKLKWPFQRLLARGQRKLLRRWLRYAENLSDTEHEMVYIFEPKVGRTLNDEEGRSVKDPIDYQEDNNGNSYCEVGNEMRSIDLIDFQEGRREIRDC
jgi:hypothetical protein